MKDVNVYFFTHNVTFSDELIDNPLAIKHLKLHKQIPVTFCSSYVFSLNGL